MTLIPNLACNISLWPPLRSKLTMGYNIMSKPPSRPPVVTKFPPTTLRQHHLLHHLSLFSPWSKLTLKFVNPLTQCHGRPPHYNSKPPTKQIPSSNLWYKLSHMVKSSSLHYWLLKKSIALTITLTHLLQLAMRLSSS